MIGEITSTPNEYIYLLREEEYHRIVLRLEQIVETLNRAAIRSPSYQKTMVERVDAILDMVERLDLKPYNDPSAID